MLAILTRIVMLKFKCREARKGVEKECEDWCDTTEHQAISGLAAQVWHESVYCTVCTLCKIASACLLSETGVWAGKQLWATDERLLELRLPVQRFRHYVQWQSQVICVSELLRIWIVCSSVETPHYPIPGCVHQQSWLPGCRRIA